MDRHLKGIPQPVVRRLPKYLTQVQDLRKTGVEWVSSSELAEALGLTSSTVRQDLSHLEISGISKRGYETRGLEAVLHGELGGDVTRRAIVVGAGNLGCALARHEPFAEQGFEICGLFDADPGVIGVRVGRLTVLAMEVMPAFVAEWGVDIGVIAVPARAAQQAAEQLVAAGVRGLLNLACAHIRVPGDAVVVDARILESLQELSCLLHMNRKNRGGTRNHEDNQGA